MTQDEIIEIAQECKLIGMRPHLDGIYSDSLVAFANLVAAKERETLAQTQEPVAWLSEGGNFSFVPYQCSTPLYTTPPQRTWVGLDHQDKKKFSSWLDHKTDDEVFTAIDDLLREMNT